MILQDFFEPFLQATPACVLARGILERLLNPSHLDELFQRIAQVQYTRSLLFSTTVELLAQVVLGRKPSVHAAYQAMSDHLGVSATAVYDKLQNLELAVSEALVRDSALRARPLIEALGAVNEPWLKGYHTKLLDGNHLAATEHRPAELRTTWAAPLPGKGLVVFDQPTGLLTHILLSADGQAQERALLPDVLPLVKAGDLWVADRNLCTFGFLFGIHARQACFVIRQQGTIRGTLVGKRKSRGRSPTGAV